MHAAAHAGGGCQLIGAGSVPGSVVTKVAGTCVGTSPMTSARRLECWRPPCAGEPNRRCSPIASPSECCADWSGSGWLRLFGSPRTTIGAILVTTMQITDAGRQALADNRLLRPLVPSARGRWYGVQPQQLPAGVKAQGHGSYGPRRTSQRSGQARDVARTHARYCCRSEGADTADVKAAQRLLAALE
jgi:hypothetical protein